MILGPKVKPEDIKAAAGVEEFRLATAATARAISREPEVEVEYVSDSPSASGNTIRVRRPPLGMPYREVSTLRGHADSAALRVRHHDPALHTRYSPRDGGARAVFNALEQARCDALGARRMAGVASNLDAALEERYQAQGFPAFVTREQAPLAEMVRLLARESLTGQEPPPAARKAYELWRSELEVRIGAHLPELVSCCEDQRAFAAALRGLLKDLGFPDEAPDYEQDPDDSEFEDDDTSSALNEGEAGEAEAGAPESMEGMEMRDAAEDEAGEAADSLDHLDPSAMDFGADDSEMPGEAAYPPHGGSNVPDRFAYHAYCTAFDETIDATDLCEPDELTRLRQNLDQQLAPLQGVIGRLANRLQRRLLARQTRAWEFDLEEGLLDTARLARVVANPLYSLSYKQEKETKFRDTVVSLLIDNSGSMRGRPIVVAATSADILARTLERCGVRVEILGFTTRAWKGGTVAGAVAGGRQAAERGTAQRSAPHRLQVGRRPLAPGAQEPRHHAPRGDPEGEHRRGGARLGLLAPARAPRATADPDGDQRRCAGGRFDPLGQPEQLPRAAPAPGDCVHREPDPGGAARDRHRPTT